MAPDAGFAGVDGATDKETGVLKPGTPWCKRLDEMAPGRQLHRIALSWSGVSPDDAGEGGSLPLGDVALPYFTRPRNEMQPVTGIHLLFPKGAGRTRGVRTSGHALGAALPDLCESASGAAIDSRPARRFPEKKRKKINSVPWWQAFGKKEG